MHSAFSKILVLLLLAAAGAIAHGQVNPHTQIRWPANCRTSNGQIYNWYTNQCQDINAINPGTQLQWPAACTAGMVYDASINNCIYSMTSINPGSQLNWPGNCNTGSQVYAPSLNACITSGTASNPAGASTQVQYNNGGTFGADSAFTYNQSTHTLTMGTGGKITAPQGNFLSNGYSMAFLDANFNYVANGTAISPGAGNNAGILVGVGAGTNWGTSGIPANNGQVGLVAIGYQACNACKSQNGSVAIGYNAMKNVPGGLNTDGEDQNSIAIGPYAMLNDNGSAFEVIAIGNKTYMNGSGEACSVMIGTHQYGPTNTTVPGNCGQSNNVYLGGQITAPFLGTGSFVNGNHNVIVGGDVWNQTGFATNTTFNPQRLTIVGGYSGQCFFNSQGNTLVGEGIAANYSCSTMFGGSNNVYIASGAPGAGNNQAPNWTGGAANFVITGQQYGGTSAVGGNISTGSGNVLIGGGAGAAVMSSNLLTAIGNGACKSTFRSGNVLNDVCLGDTTDIGTTGTITNATALGSGATVNGNGAVQIGSGTNATTNTLQFQGWNFLDSSGNGKFANLSATGGSPSFSSLSVSGGVTSGGLSALGSLNTGALLNYVGYSDLLSHTGWTLAQGTVTVTENSLDVSPPFTGTQVNKLVFGSTSSQWVYVNASAPTIVGNTYSNCAFLRGAAGGEVVYLGNNQNATVPQTLTTNWQYICANQISSGSQANRSYVIVSSGGSPTIYCAGVLTVPVGSPTVYLAVNNGTPITTGTATVNIPFLAAGPVTVNSTNNLVNAAFGVATLVSGTVTVSNIAACAVGASCIYKLFNCGPTGTAIGVPSLGTVTVGTSFIINSISATNTVVTGDTSKVCWQIN